MTEMTEEEVMDLIDLMASRRYRVDGIDFLCAYSEGTAEELFPGSHDLCVLASFLEDEVRYDELD